MFVLCVLYSKGQKAKPRQSGQRSTDKVQRTKKKIPPEILMSVSCKCCVLSGRGLCEGPIPHPKEFYKV